MAASHNSTLPSNFASPLLILPDEVLFSILSYTAVSTEVGPRLCTTLCLLSRQFREDFEGNHRSVLWSLITRNLDRSSQGSAKDAALLSLGIDEAPRRRQSSRLQKATPKGTFCRAYRVLIDRTENALLELAECAHCSPSNSPGKSNCLTLKRLRRILHDHGPSLLINRRARTGGTFLVELCRARHVSENVIAKCIQFLIESHGADPNVPSAEGGSSVTRRFLKQHDKASILVAHYEGRALYPLVVASARGMPKVVDYLLSRGADVGVRGSSRFRLLSNPRKCVKGVELTALEFAQKMKKEELNCGIEPEELSCLNKVIFLLSSHHSSKKRYELYRVMTYVTL